MKFYLIPITEDIVYIGDKALQEITQEKYPLLMKREQERVDILYSEPIYMPLSENTKNIYRRHNLETKELYRKMGVPKYIIAIETEKGFEEILTKINLSYLYPAAISVREVSEEEALMYYLNESYIDTIKNYLDALSISDSPFTYNIEANIEGFIGDNKIQGPFKGKITIRSLIKK